MAARNSGTTCGATPQERATVDTSGFVVLTVGNGPTITVAKGWSDLDPFTQGYIEALFADFSRAAPVVASHGVRGGQAVGFSDLAPETLAAILKDCARTRDEFIWHDERKGGRDFWNARQKGWCDDYAPLTATLSDDGKVRLGAQPQAKHREDPK